MLAIYEEGAQQLLTNATKKLALMMLNVNPSVTLNKIAHCSLQRSVMARSLVRYLLPAGINAMSFYKCKCTYPYEYKIKHNHQ